MRKILFMPLLAFAVTVAVASASAQTVPQDRAALTQSFAPLVEQVAPAVVNIYAKRMVRQRANPLFDDPFFGRFFGDVFRRNRPKEERSLGSGVIMDGAGLVVTNHHVVADAEDITVVLNDRREFEARLVLSDEDTDLAVLSIEPEGGDLPFLRVRSSDTIRVGDIVLAIGNPFGVGQTVTSGIISGLARSHVTDSGGPQSFIQTDAAVNPGNSGGALVGIDGLLVGVNTAIFSRSGGSHGVGFAIPADLVAAVVQAARNGTGLVRAWVGMEGQDLTADLAQGIGRARPGGVLVADLYPGGAAERAGLRQGDVVLRVDGRAVRDPAEMQFRIATLPIGGEVDLTVWRRGETLSLALPLEAAPEDPPRDVVDLSGSHPLQGAKVGNMSPAFALELDLDPMQRGVIILGVRRGAPVSRFDFRPGDIIRSVNGRPVERTRGLDRRLADEPEQWVIDVLRAGRAHQVRARRNS
ncbi:MULTISPECIES: Do family serine endopeptidase [unclassified Minwuia]|jgi:Do/DeqQ family serine protease|uniref:Do family serine endopeptidase n=1 Tax=unclassified Minwuia TaxID=2618799 RepID=UPI0024786255|nr:MULTISPECIES: Do family serine endopeptidase [unclassified Minwuia]